MKLTKILSLFFLGAAAVGAQNLTFNFTSSDGELAGLANADGDTSPGLSWGLLVAEEGSDFSQPFFASDVGLSTVDGSELTPGIRFFDSGAQTAAPFPFGEESTNGGAVLISQEIVFDSFPDINSGDSFAVIWFDTGISAGDTLFAGDAYGIVTDPGLILPESGQGEFGQFFPGTDPVRPASLTVLQAIPEPSSILLVSLGSMALLRRRRA